MSHKVRLAVIGLSSAAALALAGCGSSASDSATSSAASAGASAASSMAASESSAAAQSPASSPAASGSMATGTGASAAAGDIVAGASANPTTSTLVTALDAAGLVSALQAPGPFTVFAPTDEAFAALPAGMLDKLVQPQNKEALTKILTYHVVNGEVMAADVKDGSVPTLEGQTVTLSTANGVTVNGAKVTTADVDASNGVIHLIDTVLLPPGLDPATLQ